MIWIILISVIVILLLLFISIALSDSSNSFPEVEARKINSEINKNYKKLKSKEPELWKSAVTSMDKTLDHTLKIAKAKGNTLGERLKFNKNLFKKQTYNKVWEAHKVRNKLVHEIGFEISQSEASRYVGWLKNGIREIMN